MVSFHFIRWQYILQVYAFGYMSGIGYNFRVLLVLTPGFGKQLITAIPDIFFLYKYIHTIAIPDYLLPYLLKAC